MLKVVTQITINTVWSDVFFLFFVFFPNIFTVTFNNFITGQRKTLIRQRALWRAGLSAPSLAIYPGMQVFVWSCQLLDGLPTRA